MTVINNGNHHGAYIGRPFTPVYDHRTKITKCNIDKFNSISLDYTQKQHTFIIGKSGSGKSYLAGVIAEELVRLMDNYATLLVDPMGIFSTLTLPNNNSAEIRDWNDQLPHDVLPVAIDRCTTWVPAGDVDRFMPGTFDRTFSLKAPEFSYGTLCYAFDMNFLEPQVNLYRKCQKLLKKENRGNYTLGELIMKVRDEGPELSFKSQTIEALTTKLEALHELGIISPDAPAFHEMIQERSVSVFDLSQSSIYAARILVNFLAEKLLALRRQITRMVLKARTEETKIEKPPWYVPPVQLLIDEAHNFLPRNPVLKKAIKEGRNCGLILTAISQSPDLTRDVYANITHVFVGSLVYDDDISAVRAMLPIEQSPKEFKKAVYKLTKGMFLYYNVDEKIEKLILVRPRRTLHPASTDLIDERQYFKHRETIKQLRFNAHYTKLDQNTFSTVRLSPSKYEVGDLVEIVVIGMEPRLGTILHVYDKHLGELPTEFLTADTDTTTRHAAITTLRSFYPKINDDTLMAIIRVQYKEGNQP